MERVAMFNKYAIICEIVRGGTANAPRAHDELNAMIAMMADEWLMKKQKNKKFHITLRSIEKDAEGYIMITMMYYNEQ